MPTKDDRLVVVASFYSTHEAHVARSLLDSEGIKARLDGEHHVTMNWMTANAVGGVKLIVHATDADFAKKILNGNVEIPDELVGDHSKPLPDEQCPACNSKDLLQQKIRQPLSLHTILLLGIPTLFAKHEMVCKACAHRWNPSENI